ALRMLEKRYPERLEERFKLRDIPDDLVELYDHVGRLRGCLAGGGLVDYDKVSELVVREIRSEKFGRVSLESPSDLEMKEE
ncbi:MAG TPA: ribosome biogenesis GTPase YlqF, partial [Pseudoneobacillus sp.]|nr:ribosome biogenesis GTPase YlqF [Pseudoneobacillus sp.]